jgi:hypothetical protein
LKAQRLTVHWTGASGATRIAGSSLEEWWRRRGSKQGRKEKYAIRCVFFAIKASRERRKSR